MIFSNIKFYYNAFIKKDSTKWVLLAHIILNGLFTIVSIYTNDIIFVKQLTQLIFYGINMPIFVYILFFTYKFCTAEILIVNRELLQKSYQIFFAKIGFTISSFFVQVLSNIVIGICLSILNADKIAHLVTWASGMNVQLFIYMILVKTILILFVDVFKDKWFIYFSIVVTSFFPILTYIVQTTKFKSEHYNSNYEMFAQAAEENNWFQMVNLDVVNHNQFNSTHIMYSTNKIDTVGLNQYTYAELNKRKFSKIYSYFDLNYISSLANWNNHPKQSNWLSNPLIYSSYFEGYFDFEWSSHPIDDFYHNSINIDNAMLFINAPKEELTNGGGVELSLQYNKVKNLFQKMTLGQYASFNAAPLNLKISYILKMMYEEQINWGVIEDIQINQINRATIIWALIIYGNLVHQENTKITEVTYDEIEGTALSSFITHSNQFLYFYKPKTFVSFKYTAGFILTMLSMLLSLNYLIFHLLKKVNRVKF